MKSSFLILTVGLDSNCSLLTGDALAKNVSPSVHASIGGGGKKKKNDGGNAKGKKDRVRKCKETERENKR